MSGTRVFAIFDVEHDRDLYERLCGEAETPGLSIVVSGGSEPSARKTGWSERTRRGIRAADRVLVLCGEHTDASASVEEELRIAREEVKPCLLLWGRRDLMCTKPAGARATDGMYSWTSPNLQERFALMRRVEQREAAASGLKRHVRPEPQPPES